jgi:hypothetical protein
MIKSVVREHHWSPKQLGDLFLDSIDYLGLEYWYNDVLAVDQEIKSRTTPKK